MTIRSSRNQRALSQEEHTSLHCDELHADINMSAFFVKGRNMFFPFVKQPFIATKRIIACCKEGDNANPESLKVYM